MLHIQGNLQAVFDALYDMGVIEPVLKMDWNEHLHEMLEGSFDLERAVETVNASKGNLKSALEQLDTKALEILAMEVAREFAEFHSRNSASLQ